MSKTFALCASVLVGSAARLMPSWVRVASLARTAQRLTPVVTVTTSNGPLRFYTPDKTSVYWPRAAFADEPATLTWLDSMGDGDVLWDIGANVGSYAMYAARRPGVQVVAFEPNPLTFHSLVRNVSLNNLSAKLSPLCMAMCGRSRLDRMALSSEEAGSVFNSFGASGEHAIAVPGMTMDDFAAQLAPPLPTHVKIDVDNIEADIVDGGARVFANPCLRSVLIEMDSADAAATERMTAAMKAAGLRLGASEPCPNPRWYNQVFDRP